LNAAFTGPTSATLGASVSFQDQTTPAVNSWIWNFGDGTPSLEVIQPPGSQIVNHVFIAVGMRPVFMVARNTTCSDTAYSEVNVQWDCPQIGLSAGFTTNTDTVILSGLGNVQLTNTSTNATQYSWDFGDGTGADPTVNPIHVYSEVGTYTITLTAINYNCTTTTTQTIIVEEFGVGIGEILSNDHLNVYPNPNTGLFTVDLELDEPSEIEIEMNNILGQEVYQTTLPKQQRWRKEFDLSSYVKGVYALSISTNKGVLQRRIILE
jgi:PKD repeat protein